MEKQQIADVEALIGAFLSNSNDVIMGSDREASVARFNEYRATAMSLWSKKRDLQSPIITSLKE